MNGVDVRDGLVELVDDAQADLERAVRRLDAVDVLASLAASVDIDFASDLGVIERHLSAVDRSRWRNAMSDAVNTEPNHEHHHGSETTT